MTRPACTACRHFVAGGAAIEAAFPGLAALSSGDASVRFNDGLCTLHDIYRPGTDACPHFTRPHFMPAGVPHPHPFR